MTYLFVMSEMMIERCWGRSQVWTVDEDPGDLGSDRKNSKSMFTTEKKVNRQKMEKERCQAKEKECVREKKTGTPGGPGTIWLQHGFWLVRVREQKENKGQAASMWRKVKRLRTQ